MFRGLALTIGAAAVLSACGGVTRPAMTVNGSEYSKDELRSELGVVASLEGLQAVAADPSAKPPSTTKAKSYSAELTAQALTNELYGRIIHAEFVAKKLTLPASVEEKAKIDAATNYGGQAVFAKLPKEFQARAVVRQKEIEALRADAVGIDPKAYFDTHKDEFAQTCVSHLLVKTIEEATAARDRVTKGEGFAAVAKSVSTDSGSKDQGGALGCGDVSQYVKPFADVAKVLKIDELSTPVKTEFGFHILKVTKRAAPVFDNNQRAAVLAKLEQGASAKLSERLSARLKSAKVTVDPSIGTYVLDGGQGLPVISPAGTPRVTVAAPSVAAGH